MSGTIQHQQLMPEQHGFGENCPHLSGTNQTNKDGHDMDESEDEIANAAFYEEKRKARIVAQIKNSPWTASAGRSTSTILPTG